MPLGLIRKILGGEDAARADAEHLYAALMAQSRQPAFYGAKRIPDSQEGRLEALFLHMAPVIHALRSFGEDGRRLAQALFDTMRQDFDTALREEGYTDSGVKRRIKPMIQRFYANLKSYTEAFEADADLADVLAVDLTETDGDYLGALGTYAKTFMSRLDALTLGEIAQARLPFPDPPLPR